MARRRKFEEQDIENLTALEQAIEDKDTFTIRELLPKLKARRAKLARGPEKLTQPKGRIITTGRGRGLTDVTAAKQFGVDRGALLRRETRKQRGKIETEEREEEALERVAGGEQILRELGGQPSGISFLQQIQSMFKPETAPTEEADPAVVEINSRAQTAIRQGIDPQIVQDFRETAIRNVAIEALQSRNFPVTEGNIQEVVSQLKQQPPTRRTPSPAKSGVVGLGAELTER